MRPIKPHPSCTFRSFEASAGSCRDLRTSPSTDALGSVTRLTDTTGATASTYRYDAFGTIRSQTGSSNTYGFSSRENEATLMYFRTRYYDPSVGRFTSSDSARLCGGYNHYAYVDNNPANKIDPSGQGPLNPGYHMSDGGGDSAISPGVSNNPIWYGPEYETDWNCVTQKFGTNCACLLSLVLVPVNPVWALELASSCAALTPPGLCTTCTIVCGAAGIPAPLSAPLGVACIACIACIVVEAINDIRLCSKRLP
jgi:RHS repeat-associated protein